MTLSRRAAWFLVGFGVWSWIIWPTFLKNIWGDPRSWHHGATGFFVVHAVLTAVSLILGTAIGILGIRGVRGVRDAPGRTTPGSVVSYDEQWSAASDHPSAQLATDPAVSRES